MTRSGQDPHRAPETLAAAGSWEQPRERQLSNRDERAAWRLVGLAVLEHMLRSRRFQERVAVAAIVLAALAGLGREDQGKILARLAAWEQRQAKRLEYEAGRQAKRLERETRRQVRQLNREVRAALA